MKLPILQPSPDTRIPSDVLLQQLQEELLGFNWLWRSTAGGLVCQWGKQWWSLCGREPSPPGTKHSRELTQAGYSATPHPHSLPRLLCPPVFSSDMFLSFCPPVCLFLSVFSPQRQLFSPGAGGRAEKCHGCTDLLQLGLLCCLSLTEGHCFPSPLWEMAELQRLDRVETGGGAFEKALVCTVIPA